MDLFGFDQTWIFPCLRITRIGPRLILGLHYSSTFRCGIDIDGSGSGGGGGGGGGGCNECGTAEESADAPADAADAVHVLYRSPEAACTPSWDAATGGSPTNYSPTVHVTRLACRSGPFRGTRQSLRLVFRNGRRNLHLTGAEGAPPCDLGLQLEFEPVAAPAAPELVAEADEDAELQAAIALSLQ